MIKCYICTTKSGHRFNECMSIECTCQCVKEIYAMPKNQQEDDIAVTNPKFLTIDNAEIKTLPDLAKEVTEFNRIDKSEWLPKKTDKRFKKRMS